MIPDSPTPLDTALDLEAIRNTCRRIPAVRKDDLEIGDWVLVTTRNSIYVIGRTAEGRFTVSGGWFDLEGHSPAILDVNGCTFGGHAINTELLAAPGLFLEFENRVKTTRIREVRHYRAGSEELVS